MQRTAGKNTSAQPTAPLQPLLGTRTQRQVHPITRSALLHADEGNALDDEFPSDQGIQINALHKDIAACGGWLGLGQIEFATQRGEYLAGEECDLAFVILLETEEAIAANALAGHAVQTIHLHHRILARRLSVMAKEVVPGREKQMGNGNHTGVSF